MSKNPVFEVRGLNVTTTSFVGEAEFRSALAGPRSWGVNTLIFDLLLEQDGTEASNVRPMSGLYGSTDRLIEIVKVARAMGFEIWIKPIVFTTAQEIHQGTSAYQWSSIAPRDASTWFESYGSSIKNVLRQLEPYGIDSILLGNELANLTTSSIYQDYWSTLISDFKEVFSGHIGYNASAFGAPVGSSDEYSSVTFLDKIDFLGISIYPQLYSNKTPSAEEMQDGWFRTANGEKNIVRELRDFFTLHPNLNLAVTEFSSAASDGGNFSFAKLGFDAESPGALIRDLEEQRLFYEVGFQVLSREFGDQIKGIFPFRWGANTFQGFLDVPPDQGIYTFDLQGKPAAEVIASWYRGDKNSNGTKISGRFGADSLAGGFYDDSIFGGRGNDTLIGGRGDDLLFGDGSLGRETVVLKVIASGAILDGTAPKVNVNVNGELVGVIDVEENESFRSPEKQSWNGPVVYSFEIPEALSISDLRLTQLNHQGGGTYINRNFYVHAISVDDVALSPAGTLFDSNGNRAGQDTQAIYLSGSLVIDAKGYNAAIQGSGSDEDLLIGGIGLDTGIFRGNSLDYAVTPVRNVLNPDTGRADLSGFRVVDVISARDGIDVLAEVERLKFKDRTIALDIDANAGQAYRIYKAAFDRTPDGGGLGYWIAQMDKGMGVVEVAARFIDSSEFRELYGQNPSNAEFLTKVYSNVLDRTPDPAGLGWWVNEMKTNPTKTWQKVLADFAESSENQSGVASLIDNGITYEPWVG
jgi:hypothetical protein